MKKDKAKHSILTMSKFGIIEMTRQKKGSRTTSLVSESCSYCHGSGLVTKKDIICYDIVREIILYKKETKKKEQQNKSVLKDAAARKRPTQSSGWSTALSLDWGQAFLFDPRDCDSS